MLINYPKIFELVRDGNLVFLKDTLHHYSKLKGAFDPNFKDDQKRNILHWGCYFGKEVTVYWLLDNYQFDLGARDALGYSIADLAIMSLHRSKKFDVGYSITKFVRYLLQKGVPLYGPYRKSENALHWACYFGIQGLVELVLENNFDLIYERAAGKFAIDYLFLNYKPDDYKIFTKEIFKLIVTEYKARIPLLNPTQLTQLQEIPHSIRQHSDGFDELQTINEPKIAYETRIYNKIPRSQLMTVRSSSSINNVKLIELQNIVNPREMQMISETDEPEIEQFAKVRTKRKMQSMATSNSVQNQIPHKLLETTIYQIYCEQQHTHHPPKMKLLNHFLYWSAYLDDLENLDFFLRLKISPFHQIFDGFSAFHIAASRGSFLVLSKLLQSQYVVLQSKRSLFGQPLQSQKQLDLSKEINVLTKHRPQTALHLAVENGFYECARILIQYGASFQILNHRNLRPFELTFNDQIQEFYATSLNVLRNDNFYERGYFYVLQTKARSHIQEDIVYIQLLNIKEKLEKDGIVVDFLVLFGHSVESATEYQESGENNPEFLYYVIKLSKEAVYRLAARYKIELYHLKKRLIQEFEYQQKEYFEFPKHYHMQQIVLSVLEEEFNVEKFLLEGLLLQHFPIQDLAQLEQIRDFWDKEIHKCIFDFISIKSDQLALRPINCLSQYYGPVIGWYFAFLSQLCAWLILPSLFGLGFGIMYITSFNLNSPSILFYGLFIAMWATLFLESWKRRENELNFTWDLIHFSKTEHVRVMYQGRYIISRVCYTPELYDSFTSFKRRMIVDLPIQVIGVAINVCSFWIFSSLDNQPVIRSNIQYKVLLSSINGMVMTLTKDTFKYFLGMIVQWENHKYESEQSFSYITKLFPFEFMNSYMLLFYSAIFDRDPVQLGISVASITITRGLIQNVRSNVVPFLKNIYNSNKIYHRIENTKSLYLSKGSMIIQRRHFPFVGIKSMIITQQSPKSRNVCPSKTQDRELPPLALQIHIKEQLNQKDQLELLGQLEKRNFMQNQKPLIDEYTDLAIQFGYITMFCTSFPPAPIFFMINCYINLRFSIHNYANIMKREQAKASYGLGIWLDIFTILGYASTIMNCLLTALTYKEQLNNLIGGGTMIRNMTILVIIEHLILLVKYMISLIIDDVPKWVQKELDRANLIKDKDYQESVQKYANISLTKLGSALKRPEN